MFVKAPSGNDKKDKLQTQTTTVIWCRALLRRSGPERFSFPSSTSSAITPVVMTRNLYVLCFSVLTLGSVTCTGEISTFKDTQRIIHQLYNLTSDLQVKKSTKLIPLIQSEKERGVYESNVRLNFHGRPEISFVRDDFSVFDNNMFVTSWVTSCLLEAFKYGDAPKPTTNQLVMALDAISKYHDKNLPYQHSIMIFWTQILNRTSSVWESTPKNLVELIKLTNYLPVKTLEEILKLLGFADLEEFIEELMDERWAEKTNATGGHYVPEHGFKHAFLLTCLKFLGQLLCLALYRGLVIKCRIHVPAQEDQDQKKYNRLIFLPCAMCEVARTGLLYVGLMLTYPTSRIMLRGSLLFFTALLSVAFLARVIKTRMWIGIGGCVIGLGVIGMKDYLPMFGRFSTYDPYGIAAGDLLIVMAHIMTATQSVLEERFVNKYNIRPLMVLGLEGLCGFIMSSILCLSFYFVDAGAFSKLPYHRLEDVDDAFRQIGNSLTIGFAVTGYIVSLTASHYFGIWLIKSHGAVHRMVLDTISGMIVWAVFMFLRWQSFVLLQLLGFAVVIIGVLLYYDLVFMPIFEHMRRSPCCPAIFRPLPEDQQGLLTEENQGIQENGNGRYVANGRQIVQRNRPT